MLNCWCLASHFLPRDILALLLTTAALGVTKADAPFLTEVYLKPARRAGVVYRMQDCKVQRHLGCLSSPLPSSLSSRFLF